MSKKLLFSVSVLTVVIISCGGDKTVIPPSPPTELRRPASIGIIGDTTDITTSTTPGVVLMGGGTDVDQAFRWMINRSGGGDVVIVRASGTAAYNEYVDGLGSVNSVETLLINSRQLADDENVAKIIREAEMLFIAGGDQSHYVRYWKGTKTEDAINYLLNEKKVPVGGTSAGCAILGSSYYTGEAGSVTSIDALENPFHAGITIGHDDFLEVPFLNNLITDQHYLARNREGRHVAFIARTQQSTNAAARGIAVDERTAVCIDEKGIASVIGSSKAYFIQSDLGKLPEKLEASEKLEWNSSGEALAVYEVQGSASGNGTIDVSNFLSASQTGGTWQWWWVSGGILNKQIQ